MIEWIKTIFKDRPDTSTPITAKWLNDLQDWILSVQTIVSNLRNRYVGGGINAYFSYVANGGYPKPWTRTWLGTDRVVIVEWYATNLTKTAVISSGKAKIAYRGDSFNIITNSREVTNSNITLSLTTDGVIQFHNGSGYDVYLYASLIGS